MNRCTCIVKRSRAFPEGIVVELCGRCAALEQSDGARSYREHVESTPPARTDDDAPPPEDDSIPMDEDEQNDEDKPPWES